MPKWTGTSRIAAKLAAAGVAIALLTAVGGWLALARLRPPLSPWREIYLGVDYLCEVVQGHRLLAIRVHLDAPGLELMMRPLDPDAVAQGGQYRLAWPDLERDKHRLSILMNTALYSPGESWLSYPGRIVRAGETVIINGRVTHIDPHSYVLWLNHQRQPFQEMEKPPSPSRLATAEWGVGVQGVQVAEGRPRYQALGGIHDSDPRSFLGFDADQRLLYLLAYENATGQAMIDSAVRLGVKFGGALDGGTSTWLILGSDAKGLRPYTGIRGGRPLGPYLGVRAKPLPQ